jgi:hypothetical protein
MEDYIFLIIAVALSIFGAINQNKKKKDAENPLSEKKSSARNFFMDQLLGQDFLAEPIAEVKPQVMVKPKLKKEPLVQPTPLQPTGLYHTTFVSTLPDRSKKPLQPSLRKTIIEPAEPESDLDESPGYLEDFSLRKAFVYSEIMQRKY